MLPSTPSSQRSLWAPEAERIDSPASRRATSGSVPSLPAAAATIPRPAQSGAILPSAAVSWQPAAGGRLQIAAPPTHETPRAMARSTSMKEEFASAVGCCQAREGKEAARDSAVIQMGGMEDRSLSRDWSPSFSTMPVQETETGGDVTPLYERARRTIRTLEQERNTQELELQKNAQELAQLRAQQVVLLDKVEKCMPLEARLQEAQDKVQALQDERDALHLHIQALKGSQSPKGSAPEQATAQLQEALKQVMALQGERNALRFQAEASAKAVVDLESERRALADKLERSMAAAEQSEVAQNRVIALVQEERDAERRRGSEVSMQREKSERQLKDVEQEAANVHSQLHAVQVELHAARKQVEEADEVASQQCSVYIAQLEEANAQLKFLQAKLDAEPQNQKAFTIGGQERLTTLTLSQILTDMTTKLNSAEASWNPWTDITEVKEQTASLQATLHQGETEADQVKGA